jgi:hypothetical protein
MPSRPTGGAGEGGTMRLAARQDDLAPAPGAPVRRRPARSVHGGPIDARQIAWLQRQAGNTAVAGLVAVQRCGAVPPDQCACHDGDSEHDLGVQRHMGERANGPQTETPRLPPAPYGSFSSRILDRFSAAVTSGDEQGALQVIVNAMVARGEMDAELLHAEPVQGRAASCQQEAAVRLDPGMRWALVTPCGCMGEAGQRRPNIRLQVHPDLVRGSVIGPGRTAHAEAADRLHAVLLHEFRHIRQEAELCETGRGPQGMCTDCNSPQEMDAYLAEIEGAHHLPSVRLAWARVVGNWGYLSEQQRAEFAGRKAEAQRRVTQLFPGVDWDDDRDVRNARAHCERLGARLPGGADQHGTCVTPT